MAVAEDLGVGWTVCALGVEAAVGDGVGVAAGAAGAVAVAAATGVGDCSARAGAVPVAGTEAKARTSAATNAVFIRRGFTFIFHETAVQPMGQLSGRKRPK